MPLIFDIKRFALHDGPGIRTTVFFKGCPLRCAWCHNPESQGCRAELVTQTRKVDGFEFSSEKQYGRKIDQESLVQELLRDRQFYSESGGGVTISGGEPLMQFDELMQLLNLLRQEKVHTALDTSGYAEKDKLLQVSELADLFLYDLKLMDGALHKKYTGVDNAPIIENLDALLEAGSKVILRIPLVPGINDTRKEMEMMRDFIAARKARLEEVNLLPYHRIGSSKYERLEMEYSLAEIETPGDEEEERVRRILEKSGVKVVRG